MDALTIQKDNQLFKDHFPTTLPSMGWYFSSSPPKGSIEPPQDTWSCMFQYLDDLAQGKELCFSKDHVGCNAAACYLGFKSPSKNAGAFLAKEEKFKQSEEYGRAFYQQIKAKPAEEKYLVFAALENIGNNREVEVVNCWTTPAVLTGLVTLANFDSQQNDNVQLLQASGCQSMWTLPFKEKDSEQPKATVGALDPAMRKHIATDSLLFSLPAKRFHTMVQNIPSSFAAGPSWLGEMKRE